MGKNGGSDFSIFCDLRTIHDVSQCSGHHRPMIVVSNLPRKEEFKSLKVI